MITDAAPGFRRSATSKLIVPAELSREREVWTYDEWKVVDRATKLLESRGLHLFLGCTDPRCRNAPVERLRRDDGGMTLRCAHKERNAYRTL